MSEFDTPFRLASKHQHYKISTSHALCQKCQRIFLRGLAEDPALQDYTHRDRYETVLEILTSAQSGCKFCIIIWNRLRTRHQENLSQEFILEYSNVFSGYGQGFKLEFKRKIGQEEILIIRTARAQETFDLQQPDSCNTGSELCLRTAGQWLYDCLNNHKACSQINETSWLPSRLIYVGPLNSSMDPRVRLRKEIPTDTQYLTLSHCWGISLTTKLTEATFEQFRLGIPPSALHKTYLDALHIVRSLGYEYVWIDSLCIIQDSKEDWKKECSTMGLVYQNGVCNIAAAAGKDGSRGCFSQRVSGFFEPLIVKTERLNETAYWSISTTTSPGGYQMSPEVDSPLYTRGWVLQEWFLAPRILHFAREQIFWECSEGTASEGHPDLDDNDIITDMPSSYRSHKLAQDISTWSGLVNAYSTTALTRATDKLPALSGIAKEMEKRLGFDKGSNVSYLAGLWSHCLAKQLTWVVIHPSEARRVLNRAPSWSWASVDGNVLMDMSEEKQEVLALIDILHYETFPLGPDPFQEVTGGLLRVRGWLWKMGLSMFEFDDENNLYWLEFSNQQNSKKTSSIEVIFDDLRAPVETEPFFLPIMSERPDPVGSSEAPSALKGIVLSKAKTKPGQFIRVGRFSWGAKRPPWPPPPSYNTRNVRDRLPSVPQEICWGEEFRESKFWKPDGDDYEECTKHLGFRTRRPPLLGEFVYTISIV